MNPKGEKKQYTPEPGEIIDDDDDYTTTQGSSKQAPVPMNVAQKSGIPRFRKPDIPTTSKPAVLVPTTRKRAGNHREVAPPKKTAKQVKVVQGKIEKKQHNKSKNQCIINKVTKPMQPQPCGSNLLKPELLCKIPLKRLNLPLVKMLQPAQAEVPPVSKMSLPLPVSVEPLQGKLEAKSQEQQPKQDRVTMKDAWNSP